MNALTQIVNQLEKPWRKIRIGVTWFLIISIISCAVLASLARFLTPVLANHFIDVSQQVSDTLNAAVTIGNVTWDWQGVGPVLQVEDFELLDERQTPVITADYLNIRFSFLTLIQHFSWLPTAITLEHPTLALFQSDTGAFYVQGIDRHRDGHDENSRHNLAALRAVTLRQATVILNNSAGQQLTMTEGQGALQQIAGVIHASISGQVEGDTPSTLTFAMETAGTLDNIEQHAGKLYLELQDGQLSDLWFLAPRLDTRIGMGKLQVRAWADWDDSQWRSGQVQFAVSDWNMSVYNERLLQDPPLLNVQGHVAFEMIASNAWKITGDNFRIQVNDDVTPSSQFRMSYQKERDFPYLFESTRVQLDGLYALTTYLPLLPAHLQTELSPLQATGTLHDVALQWRMQDNHQPAYTMMSRFTDVGVQASGKIPALSGMDGTIAMTSEHGLINLYTRQANIDFSPDVFEPLILQRLQGQLEWQQGPSGWLVDAKRISILNNEGHVYGNMSLLLPKSGPSEVELVVAVTDMDVHVAKGYLPVRQLPAGLTHWLENALQAGTFTQGMVVMRGPLNEFPFTAPTSHGHLEIRFGLQDMRVNFAPTWPPLTEVEGEIVLVGNDMDITLNKAKLRQAEVVSALVQIPEFKGNQAPLLLIEGQFAGDVAGMYDYAENSPLWTLLENRIGAIAPHGDALLNLAFDLDLNDDVSSDIKGDITLDDASIYIHPAKLTLEAVTGRMDFTQDGIWAEGLETHFFDDDIIMDIATVRTPEEGNVVSFNTQGEFNVQALAQLFPHPMWRYLSGGAAYTAVLRSYDNEQAQHASLSVTTSLDGVQLSFPKPLAKAASQNIAATYEMSWFRNAERQYRVHYGDQVNAVWDVGAGQPNTTFNHGEVVLGNIRQARLPQQPGLSLVGHTDYFNLNDWLDMFASVTDSTNTQETFFSLEEDLRHADLSIGMLKAMNFEVQDALVYLSKDEQNIVIDLKAQVGAGHVELPLATQEAPISIDLAACHYFSNTHLQEKDAPITHSIPQNSPAFNFKCDDFYYNEKAMGAINLVANPSASGLDFTTIQVTTPDYTLAGNGAWIFQNNRHFTTLSGEVSSDDVANVFALWDVNAGIEDSSGRMTYALSWAGVPADFNLKTLNGEIDLDLSQGQITEVQLGLGRIVGLLNIQSITRRLRLDFTDLFKPGFSFDYLRGHYLIEHGNVYTENTEIDGPSAYISMEGRLGIEDEDLDLQMDVVPHFTGGLPLATAIATGNPAVGAVVWVVDRMLSPQLARIVHYNYHVSGTWENPEVNALDSSMIEAMNAPLIVD